MKSDCFFSGFWIIGSSFGSLHLFHSTADLSISKLTSRHTLSAFSLVKSISANLPSSLFGVFFLGWDFLLSWTMAFILNAMVCMKRFLTLSFKTFAFVYTSLSRLVTNSSQYVTLSKKVSLSRGFSSSAVMCMIWFCSLRRCTDGCQEDSIQYWKLRSWGLSFQILQGVLLNVCMWRLSLTFALSNSERRSIKMSSLSFSASRSIQECNYC